MKIINGNKKFENNLSRSDFNESWLFEEPEQTLDINAWPQIQNDIEELVKLKSDTVKELGNNLKKMVFSNDVYYWIERDGEFVVGTSLDIKPYALFVGMTGKNKKFQGVPPYASDLYLAILNDLKGTKCNLVISDKMLSVSGYKIWKKLFSLGHKVSLYDKNNPSETYKKFNSIEELDKYFSKGKEFQNYRYILSESSDAMLSAYIGFKKRKYREENNLGLED
jgi:hypothetical protein